MPGVERFGCHEPGPDDQGERHRAILVAEGSPKEIPSRDVDDIEAVYAAMAGDQLDPPGDPAIGRQGPAVAQLGLGRDPGAASGQGRIVPG